MKVCGTCKTEKNKELFSKNKCSKDGLQGSCKDCCKQYFKDNYSKISLKKKSYREANKDKISAYLKKWNIENKERIAIYGVFYREFNKSKISARDKIYYENNKDKVSAVNKIWQQNNPQKTSDASKKWRNSNSDRVALTAKNWAIRNHGKRVAGSAKRKSTKIKATPSWSNQYFINRIYILARTIENIFGGKWHVDHIIPLISPTVCGLHVHNNLQIIPAIENLKKGNRYAHKNYHTKEK